jgi:hypothetical protein
MSDVPTTRQIREAANTWADANGRCRPGMHDGAVGSICKRCRGYICIDPAKPLGRDPETANGLVHYGQLDPVDITKTLCGSPGNGSYITFRPYELDDTGNRQRPYMAGHFACQACVPQLIERGELVPVLRPSEPHKEARIAFLERKRLVTIEDLKVKVEAEDWHGCQDCGSDLRDIDNELDGLRY